VCRDLRNRGEPYDAIDDRQRRVPGFSQEVASGLGLGVIGAGGLGGHFVQGGVRKGVGELTVYDGDNVGLSNLNRQLFTPADIGKNKAVCLARNASRAGFMGTRLVAVPHFFQAAVELGLERECDAAACLVDNDETRVYVARHYIDRPVVYAALSQDACYGYVAVQEPGKACFGCFMPKALAAGTAVGRTAGACPGDPAITDVVTVVAGLALYAIDSLFMGRPRRWNFKQIALHGLFPDITTVVPKRSGCPICGSVQPAEPDGRP